MTESIQNKTYNPGVDYLYVIVLDKKGNYPNGHRVLLSEGRPGAERSGHDQLLRDSKFIQDYHVKDPQKRREKEAQGYTVLDFMGGELIEAGSIHYSASGVRKDSSRNRIIEELGDTAHQKRKDIKLVYAIIKKHQGEKALKAAKDLEKKKINDTDSFMLTYAPIDTPEKGRQVMVVPKDQTISDFIEKNNLAPYRIFSMARLGEDAQTKQPVIKNMISFEQFKDFEMQDRDSFLKAAEKQRRTSALYTHHTGSSR